MLSWKRIVFGSYLTLAFPTLKTENTWNKVTFLQVYQIPLGGMIVRRPLGAGGSGSTYIFGYLDENYRPGMNRQECEDFVKTGEFADKFRPLIRGRVIDPKLGTRSCSKFKACTS